MVEVDAKSKLVQNVSDAKSNSWIEERGQLERRGSPSWRRNEN
jgi:hypothetical protein